MAVVTNGYTFGTTEQVTAAKLHTLLTSATVTNIVSADLDAAAAVADSKLAQITTAGKVSGAAITSLPNIPAGAGVIPAANLPSTSGLSAKYISGSRAMDASSGDVAYTGVGFTPKAIIAFGLVDQTRKASIITFLIASNCSAAMFADSAAAGQFQTGGGNIYVEESAGVAQSADLKTMDSDGFTLTWTKYGSPASATVNLFFLCLA